MKVKNRGKVYPCLFRCSSLFSHLTALPLRTTTRSLDAIMQSAKVPVLPGVCPWLPFEETSQHLVAMQTEQGVTPGALLKIQEQEPVENVGHIVHISPGRSVLSGVRNKPPCFIIGPSAGGRRRGKYILFRKSAGQANTGRSINA